MANNSNDWKEYIEHVTAILFNSLMFFRPCGTVENELSLHCSTTGLVNALQTMTSLLPEAVGKTEVVPLAQVICYIVKE